ncbi:hypothetical protein [Spongiimicrobium salis]|uniref:hypothetical protein n=1 Tax=Spongiimicrobium salis TaxID=1667022 RepID=UPI00374C967E
MNSKNIVVLLVLLSTTFIYGQRRENKDKIEALRIAFLTERLDLSSAQAQQFWPIYNEHRKKMDDYRKEERKEIYGALEDIASLPDKEAEVLLEKHMKIQEKKHLAEKQYLKALNNVLGAKKIFALFKAEHAFKRRLLRQYRHKQGERRNRP